MSTYMRAGYRIGEGQSEATERFYNLLAGWFGFLAEEAPMPPAYGELPLR
jgi:hypothetical protein